MSLINHLLTAEQVRMLLARGASITENMSGANALHVAALSSIDTKEKLGILIAVGVDVNQINTLSKYHNTPLHTLIANEDHANAIFFIERAGKKLQYGQKNRQGKTTLVTAAKINSTSIALALLNQIQDADPVLNAQDNEGMTALHYACLYGNIELTQMLISKGASSSILNEEGKMPIDCVISGIDRIRAALCSVSIDPDRDEKSTSNFFCDQNRQSFFHRGSQLRDVPARQSSLGKLRQDLSLPLVDYVSLIRGEPRPISEQEKASIMADASQFTGKSVAQAMQESTVLLKNHLIDKGHFSGLLLGYEATTGHLASVEQLIRNAPHAIDERSSLTGRTALHQAVIYNHAAVCEYLITQGASLSSADKDGNTPLHLAVQRGHYELAELLVTWGADISIKNKADRNPLALLKHATQAVKQKLIALRRDFESRSDMTHTSEPEMSTLTTISGKNA